MSKSVSEKLADVLDRLENVRPAGEGFAALCPAHDDSRASLSICEKNGRILFKCHKGCSYKEILWALGQAAHSKPKPMAANSDFVATYGYMETSPGPIKFEICRTKDKQFRARRRGDKGEWVWSVKGIKLFPYRLPDIKAAVRSGEAVFIVEGEKDANNVKRIGLTATSNPFGAGKWKAEYSEFFKGVKDVVILPDNDQPGKLHAQDVAQKLKSTVPNIKIVELPGLGEKEDVSNWLERGGTKEQLLTLVKNAPPWVGQSEPDSAETSLRATDLGNAERLIVQYGDILQYCPPMASWFIWDDRRWALDTTNRIYELAFKTVRTITQEADKLSQLSDREKLLKHALHSESKFRFDGMVSLAGKIPGVPILPDQLDKDPMLLNALNGTVDLITGKLSPHRKEDFITKLAPVSCDPAAKCPYWEEFLKQVTCHDQELQSYLQKVVGYCLTGQVSEQKLFFLYGLGANGKSAFLQVLMGLFGEYATKTASEFLMRKPAGSHTTDITDLKGVRLAVTVEVQEGRQMAESLVKELTGGDTVKARRMRQDNMQWEPTHKIFLAANHKPVVNETTRALWRRIDLIPFNLQLPENKRVKDIHVKLLEEKDGIFQWALRGCLRWQKEGLPAPKIVQEATQRYRDEMDTLAEFIESRCVVSVSARVTKEAMSHAYKEWCDFRGIDRMGQKEFPAKLRDKGFQEGIVKGVRGWLGIGLLQNAEKSQKIWESF